MASKNTTLNKQAKEVFKKHKEDINDIILFGSSMKGKKDPNDLDVLIIFKSKIDKNIEKELKDEFKPIKTDLMSTTEKEMKEDGFIAKEGIYLEGLSLITNKPLNESLGFTSIAFIKYDLSKIKGSNRTMFYYALLGRNNNRGFLEEVGAKRYSDSVIICNYGIIERVKPFFEQWKLPYKIIPALVPKRLKHILL